MDIAIITAGGDRVQLKVGKPIRSQNWLLDIVVELVVVVMVFVEVTF